MITKIVLDNLYYKGECKEFVIPDKIIGGRSCSYNEWEDFEPIVKTFQKIKKLLREGFYVFSEYERDYTKESTLEIHMKLGEKTYTYYMVFEKGLVMESLLENQNWIFSRFKDNPEFALNESFLTDLGKKHYKFFEGAFSVNPLLYCFKPGEELLKEFKDTIIVDDWASLEYYEFLSEFKTVFPSIEYDEVINWIISSFGFDDYSCIERESGLLISSINPKVKVSIQEAGDGFKWLSKLVPLMVASKKLNLRLLSSIPLDCHVHPVLGKSLMKWYLKDNPNIPVARISNFEL